MNRTPWPDIMDLLRYWKKNRPVHLLVKNLLHDEEEHPEAEPAQPSEAELHQIAGMFGM